MFFKIDSTRATLQEYWWECRAPWMWPIFLIAVLLKLLRVRLTGSSDDANVESLSPFRVPEAVLTSEVRAKFLPWENELAELGFHSPVYHAIDDGLQGTQYRFSTLCHESGQALARIHLRIWTQHSMSREYFFPVIISAFDDGTFLVTSGGKADVLSPPNCRVIRQVGAAPAALWQAHQSALEEELLTKTLRQIDTQSDLLAAAEAFHAAHRAFHVARGFFVPMTAQQEQLAVEKREKLTGLQNFDDARVLEEIENRQNRSRSWTSAVLILGVSLLLFVSLGSAVWNWKFVLLLLPILFVHELGHYVAMRWFKYRNLRMFFIPLFGAAVTGSHYNVPGWKKVIVSLMGPLPGIAAAVPLAIASWWFERPLLMEAAVLAVILNGMNLLPVLPLDGGWVANTLFFSRHYLLNVAFYAVAIVLLFLASRAVGDRILLGLAIIMLLGLRWVYQRGKIAHDLRKSGFEAVSADSQTIPQDVALEIVKRVRMAFPRGLNAKRTADLTLQVFETLNARPPGWLATIALSFVYVGGLVSAIVLAGVLVFVQHGDPQSWLAAIGAAATADQPIACGSVDSWSGDAAKSQTGDVSIIVGTLADRQQAEARFAALRESLPPTATQTLFGQTILISLPANDSANREKFLSELDADAEGVFVDSAKFRARLQLTCVAPSSDVAEEIKRLCEEYIFAGGETQSIPPWSQTHALTPAHRKARKTYRAIQEAQNVYEDARFADLNRKIQRALRTGDAAAMEELGKEQIALSEKLRQERLDTMRADEERYDARVVDHYRTMPVWDYGDDELDYAEPDDDYMAKFRAWSLELGTMLGQLPLEAGKPVGAAADERLDTGSVDCLGPMVTFQWMSFERVDRGAPALLDWLCRQGCSDVKYSLSPIGFSLDDESAGPE